MEAGRELDQLVGEKVFGYRVTEVKSWVRPDKHIANANGSYTVLPSFSTHLSSAWHVVVHFTKRGFSFSLTVEPGDKFCRIQIGECSAEGATASLAICLAALKLVATPTVTRTTAGEVSSSTGP